MVITSPVSSLCLSHLSVSPLLCSVSSVWRGADRATGHHPVSRLAPELLQGAGLCMADPRERGETHRAGCPDVSIAN